MSGLPAANRQGASLFSMNPRQESSEKTQLGFPGGSVVRSPSANAGDMGSSPWSGKTPTSLGQLSHVPRLQKLSRPRAHTLLSLGPGTTTPERVLCQLQRPMCPGARAHKRNHRNEKLSHRHTRGQAPLLEQQRGPSTPTYIRK